MKELYVVEHTANGNQETVLFNVCKPHSFIDCVS